jgi:hypothetical protein
MAFLDNSGDIILDAVLTDTGRLRLAKGDGTFKITKFVLADDEINYNLYNKNHPSGSAYYDLDVLQTPIFEAFTNNSSVVKHTLLSISRTNLLYLPVMKLNTYTGQTGLDDTLNTIVGTSLNTQTNTYLVAVDTDTENNTVDVSGKFNGATRNVASYIRIDQGIDSAELSAVNQIDSFLNETQYIVEVDNRLGKIIAGGTQSINASPSFIDDDNIASYYFTSGDATFVEQILTNTTSTSTLQTNQVIAGPRGTCIGFQITPSTDLQTSTFLFTKLGSTFDLTGATSTSHYYIDTNVVIKGVTTGSSITIPIRFIKKV